MTDDMLTRLRARARRLSPSATEAEDLVQEVLLAYLERLASGAVVDAPLPYMMTALRHAAAARRRFALRICPLEDGPEPEVPDGESACLLGEVLAAMGRLPEADQRLLGRIIAGETRPSFLARELGVPPGTVMSRLSRARKRLREALGDGALG